MNIPTTQQEPNPLHAPELIQSFPDARIIQTVSQAADQDGFDGGYVARSETVEAWGATPEAAKLALSSAQNELTKP